MSYVQQFQPKGNDLETLRYFLSQRIAPHFNDPSEQQLVAQQVYDTARALGKPEGGVAATDLDNAYLSLMKSRGIQATQTAAGQMEQIDALGGPDRAMRPSRPMDSFAHLLPQRPMGPMTAMSPTRHMNTSDANADAAGAFLYHYIDSATLGILGGLGGMLKKMGVTDENFWTEGVGETKSLLGLDFGQQGLKGADSTRGVWASAAGELAGFLGPGAAKIVAKPATALIKGAVKGSRMTKAKKLSDALDAGKIGEALTPQTTKLIQHLARGSDTKKLAKAARAAGQNVESQLITGRIMEGAGKVGKKIDKAWEFMPASFVFRKGHKMAEKFFIGKHADHAAARVVGKAIENNRTFGALLGGARGVKAQKALLAASEEATKFGAKAGYQTARTTSSKLLASELESAVLGNNAVNAAAKQAFEAKFYELAAKNTHLAKDSKVLGRMVQNASALFDDAFVAARKGGNLLTLAERAAQKGSTGMLSLGGRKFLEEATNHSVGMVLLGLTTRTMHPLAEPEIFGLEDAGLGRTAGEGIKYWLRGNPDGNPLFEGVMGDLWVGTMFGTGGLTKLLKPFQRRRITNPSEALSIVHGGDKKAWSRTLDEVDRVLRDVYKYAPRHGGQMSIGSYLKRNKVNFHGLTPRELQTVAGEYLSFLERGGLKHVPSLARSAAPFTKADVAALFKKKTAATPRSLEAQAKIADQMSKHLDEVLGAYKKGALTNLAKDLASFGVTASATAIMSAPELFKQYAAGDPGIHISSLVTHSVFALMAARHPYYLPDAPAMFAKGRPEGVPMTGEYMNQLRLNGVKNALRHLGVRDSSYFLEGEADGKGPMPVSYGSKESSDDLNGIAEKLEAEDARKSDIGEAPDWYSYEMVPTIADVEDPDTQVSQREVRAIASYISAEIARGEKVHPMFTRTTSDGKRHLIDSEELYLYSSDPGLVAKGTPEGAEFYQKLIATAIKMKKSLASKSMHDPLQELHGNDLHNANVEWNRRWFNDIRAHLENSTGLVEHLRGLMDDGAGKEFLRKIEITDIGEGDIRQVSENPDHVKAVEAWNEIVDLASDLNINADASKHAKEIRLESAEAANQVDAISKTITWFEGEINKAAGMSGENSFTLGKGYLHRAAIHAMMHAKINDSTFFLREKGVLRDSDSNVFSAENILDWAIDNNLARRDGAKIIMRDYDLAGIENRQKRMKINNLMRWLANHERVVKSNIFDDRLRADDLIKLFSGTSVGQADGIGPRVEGRHIFSILEGIGIPLFNNAHVDNMVKDAARQKFSFLQEHDWTIFELLKSTAALVNQGTGPRVTPFVIMKDAQRPGSRRMGLGEELFEALGAEEQTFDWAEGPMYELADKLANHKMKFAFTAEQRTILEASVERLSKAGLLDGWATDSMHIEGLQEGQYVREGVFQLYSDSNAKSLESFARVLHQIATVDRAGLEAEMGLALGKLRAFANDKKHSVRQRRNVRRLLKVMEQARMRGGAVYSKVLFNMIDQGVLKVGKGYKAKSFKIPSTKEALRMSESIEDYLDSSVTAMAYGHAAENRMIDRAAMDAFELLRTGNVSKINPSQVLNKIGLSSHMGMVAGITEVKGAHRKVASGEVTADKLVDEIRGGLENAIRGYSLRDAQSRGIEKLAEYKDNEILSIGNNLLVTKDFLSWSIDMAEMSGDRPLHGTPADPAAPPNLLESKFGNAVKTIRAPYKFYGKMSDEVARVHFISNMVKNWKGGKDDVDLALIKNIDSLNKVERDALRGWGGVEKSADGQVLTHDGIRLIMGMKASETGGFYGVEMPTDLTLSRGGELTPRGKMAAEMDRLLSVYSETRNADMDGVLKVVEAYRDILKDEKIDLGDFYDGGTLLPEYGNRVNMLKGIVELINYDRMFGSELVKETFAEGSHPGKRGVYAKLKAREKLITSDSVMGVDPIFAEALLLDFVKQNNTSMAELSKAGMSLDGIRAATFDDVKLGKAQGRGVLEGESGEGSPTTDSAVWVTPEIMQALYHMFGRDSTGNVFGVGKLKFNVIDADGGIYASKDALFVDPAVTRLMRENGIGMVGSRSALKLLSGMFANEVHTMKFKGGETDMLKIIQSGESTKLEGTEAIRLPLTSIDWQQEVDHNPTHAVVATNMANYKDPAVVKGLSDRFFQRSISGMREIWKGMFGNSFSPESSIMIREFMTQKMHQDGSSQEEIMQTGWYMDYLASGGVMASGNHFGMHQNVLQRAMNGFIKDHMFKGRSDAGTHAVYAPDIWGEVRPGESMLPNQAGNIPLPAETFAHLTIGTDRNDLREMDIDVKEGEIGEGALEAERLNAQYYKWDKSHFNSKAEGADVPPQKSSYTQAVQLMRGGHEHGIGPALKQLRRSKARAGKVGAKEIRNLMRLATTDADARMLAKAINDGFQELIFSDDFHRGLANAKKAVAAAIEGDFVHADGRMTADSIAELVSRELMETWGIVRKSPNVDRVPEQITAGSLMDGLSYIFGEYKYGGKKTGAVDFGLMAGGQRHPTSLPNDLVPTLVRGFLGEEYGQQTRMNLWDAERLMKADFDKDEINFWFDNPMGVMGGIMRLRGISSGFHEPDITAVKDFKPFTTQGYGEDKGQSSHNGWVRSQREAKMAIGAVQRAVNTISTMINKGVAFNQYDPELRDVYNIEPVGEMKDIMSNHHSAVLEIANMVNKFFDMKHGEPEKPISEMDLQRAVLEKFFVMNPVTPGGTGKTIPLTSNAVESLKAMMSLYSNMAGVTSSSSRHSRKFEDMARAAARYSVIMDSPNAMRNLRNYTKLSLSLGHPLAAGKRPSVDGLRYLDSIDQRRVDVLANSDIKQLIESFEIVNPSWSKNKSLLGTESITDTIARGIRSFGDAIEKDYEHSYMSALETSVIKASLDFSQSWDASLKAARGQAWLFSNDGQKGTIDALKRGQEYGEDHLAYEAAMSELEFRQYDFWAERNSEAKFGKRQRWQPRNGLELRQAVNETADGTAIELARSMVVDNDPNRSSDRLNAAMMIRKFHDDSWRQIMKPGRPSITAMTKERLEKELDLEIDAYMREYGQENTAAAMLDLVAGVPFGFYYARGNIMSRYKRFPQMIWRLAARYGIPKTGIGEVKKSIDVAMMDQSNIYEIMATSRSMVEKALNGDRAGIKEIRSWMEVQQSQGKSFASAISATSLGRYPLRYQKMRENLFVNAANSELRKSMKRAMKEDGSIFGDTPPDGDHDSLFNREPEYGFKDPRDAFKMINDASSGSIESIVRAKVLRGRQVTSGLWADRLLDGIRGSDRITIRMTDTEMRARPGSWEARVLGGARSDVAADERDIKMKKGRAYQEPSKEDFENKVRMKEKLLLDKLKQTMDSRYTEQALPQEGTEGSSLSRRYEEHIDAERCR